MPPVLELRVLGELEVWCAGTRLELPKSIKTRALLAYLALSSGPQRRERLCDLLWDVTDDRRGALRWSLSKLRRVVDDGVARLDATRTHVELRHDALEVDWLMVRRDAANLESLPVERLEALAGMYRGELLEDIAQPDFEVFDAWMTAHRTDARALRLRLLERLVERLASTPERALEYARTWLVVDPQDARASAAVERLIAARGTGSGPVAASGFAPGSGPVAGSGSVTGSRSEGPVLREALVRAVEEAMTQALQSERATVQVLLGASGAGKTWTLEHLAHGARERGAAVWRTACHALERARTYGPLVDAIDETGPSQSGIFSIEPPDATRLTRSLDRRIGTTSPTVFVLDDAHLMDEGTAEVLHHLVRRANRRPFALVLAGLPPVGHSHGPLGRLLESLERLGLLTRFALPPLDGPAIERLIADLVDVPRRAEIVAEAGGNPAVALQLARAPVEPGGGRTLTAAWGVSVGGLSTVELATTRWAAILQEGEAADLMALAEVGPLDAIAVLEQLAQRGVVRLVSGMRGGRFTFEQAATADAIARSMSPPRRAAMHLEAARYLEARFTRLEDVRAIVHHLARARDPGEATTAYVRLARRCADLGGLEQSHALIEEGLAACEALPAHERVKMEITLLVASARTVAVQARAKLAEQLHSRGTEALRGGLAEAGGGLATPAARTGGTEALRGGLAEAAASAFLRAARLRWQCGEYDLALRELREVTLAGAEAGEGRVRALAETAILRIMLDKDPPLAAATLQEAELCTEGKIPFEVLYARGMIAAYEGAFERGRAALEDACILARGEDPLAELAVTEGLLLVTLQAGEREVAATLAMELERLAHRVREGGEGLRASAVRGLLEDAIEVAHVAVTGGIEELRRRGDPLREAWLCNRWALRMAALGRWHTTLAFAEQARVTARRVPLPSEQAIADGLCLVATTVNTAERTGAHRGREHAHVALEDAGPVSSEARAIQRWAMSVVEGGAPASRTLAAAVRWLPAADDGLSP